MFNARRVLCAVLALLVALSGVFMAVPAVVAESLTTIEVYIGKTQGTVNGKVTTLEQGAVIQNGRTLVPLRFITEAMGATVAWDAATRTANLTLQENKIALTIGKDVATVNGYEVILDAPAVIINGKTLVPVRFVAESMGATTAWDGAAKKVTVTFSLDWLKNKAGVPFWHGMQSALGKSLKGLIDEFNATHPSMEIQPVAMANYTTLQTKTIGAIAANDPPLLAQAYENWAAQYATGYYMNTFDAYLDGSNGLSKAEIADYFPTMWQSTKLADGKQYMMPFNKSNVVLYYNKDMFKAAGYDHAPRTWAEFAEICEALNKVNDKGEQIQWGASHTPSVDVWYSIVHAFGGRVLSDTYDNTLFGQNPGAKAATQLFADLYAKKYMHYTTAYGDQSDLGNGKAGMYMGSVVGRSYVEAAIGGKFELGEAPLPAGPAGSAVSMYGTNIVMFGNHKNFDTRQKEAAWAFIKWFTTPHIQAVWAAQTGYLPCRKTSLLDTVLIDAYKANPETKAGLDQLDSCVLQPPTRGWNAARDKISSNLQAIYLGKVTVAEGLLKMAREVQAGLR